MRIRRTFLLGRRARHGHVVVLLRTAPTPARAAWTLVLRVSPN